VLVPGMNKPPWDMYPNSWRTDPPDTEPPNYCMLCDRGTANRQFCDPCLEMMDEEQQIEYENELDGEPDWEAMAEARDDRGPDYE
jgi:hypothetical protein